MSKRVSNKNSTRKRPQRSVPKITKHKDSKFLAMRARKRRI